MVEDDIKVASFVARGIRELGYVADICLLGDDGLHAALTGRYDVILLDLMLPDISGITLVRELRRCGIGSPVLALTAQSSVVQRIAGLDAGCDDYLAMPFAFGELAARERALARRHYGHTHATLSYGGLTLDPARRMAIREDRCVELSNKEFMLLTMFMREPERVFSRSAIVERVWGNAADVSSNVLEVYARCQRKKIDDGFATKLIHTVRGAGYSLRGVEKKPND